MDTPTRAAAPPPPPESLIRFGDGSAQFVSVLLASEILGWYWRGNPGVFGNAVKDSMVKLWAAEHEAELGANGNGHAHD